MNFADRLEIVWRTFVRYLIAPYIQPARSGAPRAFLIREDGTMLIYGVEVPPPTAADVVKTELGVSVNGGEETVVVVTSTDEFAYSQGDVVTWRSRGVDDAGNKAEWSEPFTFTASDTIPPPKSGAPSPVLLREES